MLDNKKLTIIYKITAENKGGIIMDMHQVKKLIKEGEELGITFEEMAHESGVSVSTIYRWKSLGVARQKPLAKLIKFIDSQKRRPPNSRKYLDEASLEDLAGRALELGFRTTFTNIKD